MMIKFKNWNIENPTKEQLLKEIRKERPNQEINKVIDFNFEQNFYLVVVDMPTYFFETKIKHTHVTIPWPFEEYKKYKKLHPYEVIKGITNLRFYNIEDFKSRESRKDEN